MHRWIPNRELNSLDLSELASPERALSEECERIEAKVGAHLAVYKKGTLAKPKGLCTTFKYAKLEKDSLRILRDFERKLDGLILVAYSSPLERW